jgi:hypothetical protein
MSDLPSQNRQAGESAKAHQAYLDYRDMGVSRSQRKLLEMYGSAEAYAEFCKIHNRDIALYTPHNPPTRAKSTTVIENWSSAFNWIKRIGEWEAQLQKEREEAEAAERLAERQRRADMLEKFRTKIDDALDLIDLSGEDDNTTVKKFSAVSRAVANYMMLSMKQYNDLPTEKKDITTDGKPLAVNFLTEPIPEDLVQQRLEELGLANFVSEHDE